MPNGGSDCCGTCWFNAKNKGEVGYVHADDPEPNFCIIRNLPIADPFYTYCANHPRRNPNKIDVPLGPVFTGNSSGYREIWMPSPDTEEIRLRLLELLSQIQEQPSPEYPIGIYLHDAIVWQLGEFREERAVDDLRRIINFDPNPSSTHPFARNNARTISCARAALDKILSGDSV